MLSFLRKLLSFSLILAFLGMISLIALYYFLAPSLPNITSLKETQFQVPLRIFSAEDKLIAEFGDKRRIPIIYRDIPPHLIHAILASEDDRFFEHPGVDYHGILRAVYSLATTGVRSQGGSTITMQVARNFFLSRERTYVRKLNEIILALQIEQEFSKEEILTLYLNKIYLGNRAYGVAAAAKVYYGKPLQELNLPQLAMIAGLPKAPSKFNPIVNPERAQLRRDYVLRRMKEVGHINEQDFEIAIQAPTTASYHSRKVEVYAPYIAEMVRTQLIEEYGDDAYNLGLSVYTTIRGKHQDAANSSLQFALLAYDRRHGYRGPINKSNVDESMKEEDFEQLLSNFNRIGPLNPAIVVSIEKTIAQVYIKGFEVTEIPLETLKWARKQISTNRRGNAISKIADVFSLGDIIHVRQDDKQIWQLAQLPEAEGALIAVSPFDGAVTALNGGFEYFQNKFNRVTQSRRQPGSGFKPFLYSAALEKGYTAATIINDAPVVFDDPSVEDVWRPENYSGKFYGPTRLRAALISSRNLVSIRILRDIGSNYVIDYAKKFGFNTEQMPNGLSLALGSGSAAPWDLARAYSALANGGYRVEPYVIQRIEDASGNIIMQAQPATVCETCLMTQTTTLPSDETSSSINPAKRIMTPQNNYIMNSLLRDVVRFGTGRKAMRLGRHDLAGKTGTTNDQLDAWFNGFHPELVAISWVGFDSPKTLGKYETGGKAALPMWMNFMKVALDDVPNEPLHKPADMVTINIDAATGLRANGASKKVISETFRTQYLPKEMAPQGYSDSNTFEPGSTETGEEDLF